MTDLHAVEAQIIERAVVEIVKRNEPFYRFLEKQSVKSQKMLLDAIGQAYYYGATEQS